MKQTKLLLTALALLPAMAVPAAIISFGVASGDWNLNTNWGGGVIPGAGDTAVVTNGREAIVSSVVTPVPDIIRAGNNPDGGTVTVTAGSLSGGTFQAATAGGSTGHLAISGGTLTVSNSTWLSATGTVTGTSSTLSISGGTLNWGVNLNLGTTGTNATTVTGDAATLSGIGLNAGAGTTFTFNLGVSGVSAFTGAGAMSISDGAALVVDGAAYAGGPASIPLFQFDTMTGSFGTNVTFQNFGALTPSLQASADTLALVLVPEPSLVALLAGLSGLALVLRRRAVRG